MMTNKDYERLTSKNAVVTGRFSGKTLLDRLTTLENAIENETLVFLPCKIGDKFWIILEHQEVILRRQAAEFEVGDYGIVIVDTFGRKYSLECIYFTEKAAKKALEEMGK